ncbi:DUF2271 domain-containing protein [Flavobacterium silvaticum]|nr:DUF2271 domain-containing protein [Flavobacterium silvaticum]
MNYLRLFFLLTLLSTVMNAQKTGTTKYKCMVQMTNYPGEGAYVVASLIDPKGAYEKTLLVLGQDKKWYHDLTEWHKNLGKKTPPTSAITGASAAGGDRKIQVVEIDNAQLDAGYTIRFESAVENQDHHIKDVEVPLTTENVSGKTDGTGYIRYVRFMPNN